MEAKERKLIRLRTTICLIIERHPKLLEVSIALRNISFKLPLSHIVGFAGGPAEAKQPH